MAVKVRETGYGKWKIPVIIIAVILVIICVITGILLKDSTGVDLSEESVRIEVASGDGVDVVTSKLSESGAIKYPFLFKIQSKLGGYTENIQPGAATITDGMSYSEILELLITPNRETTKVVIPEGYEVKQIAEKLCEEGLVTWDEFYDALNPEDYDYRFLQDLPERENKMEGYLFPATYEIPAGMSAHDIIDLMLAAFDNQFKDEYYEQAALFGMTVDQVITMASIVERETDSDSERAKVAGVFYNRRNAGMKFQSCATVQYILGERKPVLSIADTQIDSPYNTYLYADFPIGPICNPGIECIEAALYPEATDAYYFVLGKNGEHIFSTTYEEHLAAIAESDPTVSVDSSAIENQDEKIGTIAENLQ
ncbi:MAG: endolytic transglycosylase MltG [Oscillospiraceae bacterium]|nr:endolytic transglycosylase MltG [Oscillospiraceae bacterium]